MTKSYFLPHVTMSNEGRVPRFSPSISHSEFGWFRSQIKSEFILIVVVFSINFSFDSAIFSGNAQAEDYPNFENNIKVEAAERRNLL